jgi:8-oxo-dGTP pyrophosphatase MutT (NUDIX family)
MYPISEWTNKGIIYQFTWIKDPDILKYKPCTQVYGICFTNNRQILLIDNKGMRAIPGGSPEGSETPEETLRRELIEEADVSISKIFPLGVQKVTEKNNPIKNSYYQYRYVCFINELLPQTPDPDNGIIYNRLLVPSTEVTNHVKWGVTGGAMFNDAIELFNALTPK